MHRRSLEYVTEVRIQRHQSETEGRRRRVREAETVAGSKRGHRPRRVWHVKRARVSSSAVLRGVTLRTCLE